MKNMFLPSIALFNAIGNDSTASGPVTTAPVVVEKAKKKQHTVTLRESDKAFLNDLQAEFYGPQASNPDEKRFLSTEEAFTVILEVATDFRTGMRQATEIIDGVETPIFEEDTTPRMESFDRFAIAAAKVIAARGVKARSAKVSSLEKQLEDMRKEMEELRAAAGQTPAPVVETTEA